MERQYITVNKESLVQGIARIRAAMIPYVLANEPHNCTKEMHALSRVICDVNMKYRVIDMEKLIRENCEELEQVKRIGFAFNILEKYARHLLKPLKNRAEMWRYVKFSNSFFKERVDVIKGGREIMRKMGYTEDIDGGMAFPEGADSDPNVIAELICDILMMKYEITNLLNGEHPAPEILVDLIKPAAKSQLQVLQSVLDFQKNNREAPEQKGDSGQNFVIPLINPDRVMPTFPAMEGYVQDSGQDNLGLPREGKEFASGNRPPGAPPHTIYCPASHGLCEHLVRELRTGNNGTMQQASSSTTEAEPTVNDNDQTSNSVVCDICGKQAPELICSQCDNKQLCINCDQRWHTHPKRKNHQRQIIQSVDGKVSSMNGIPCSEERGIPETVPHQTSVTSQLGSSVDPSPSGGPETHVTPGTPHLSQAGVPVTYNTSPPVGEGRPSIPAWTAADPLGVSNDLSSGSMRNGEVMQGRQESQSMVTRQIPTSTSKMRSPSLPQPSHAAPGGPPTSKLLRRILEIQDLDRRESKIHIDLEMLAQEINDVEARSSALIDEEVDFEDEQFKSLTRRKYNLQKEKREIEKYLYNVFPHDRQKQNVDNGTPHIFCPPPISGGDPRYQGSQVNASMMGSVALFGSKETLRSTVSQQVGFVSPEVQPQSSHQPPGHSFPAPVYSSAGPTTGHKLMDVSSHKAMEANSNQSNQYTPASSAGSTDLSNQYTPVPITTLPYNAQVSQSPGIYSSMGMQYGKKILQPPMPSVQPFDQSRSQLSQQHSKGQPLGYSIAYPPDSQHASSNKLEKSKATDPMEVLARTENSINEGLVKANRESNIEPYMPFKLQKVHYPPQEATILPAPSGQSAALQLNDQEFQATSTIQDANSANLNSTLLNKQVQSEKKSPNQSSQNYSLPTGSSPGLLPGAVARSKSEGTPCKWMCEHCTFHNEADTKVCAMCSKTSQKPTYIYEQEVTEAASAMPSNPSQSLVDEEETKVLDQAVRQGQRAYNEYRQVEIEKKEAHERFQEQLRQEEAAKRANLNKKAVAAEEYGYVVVEKPPVKELIAAEPRPEERKAAEPRPEGRKAAEPRPEGRIAAEPRPEGRIAAEPRPEGKIAVKPVTPPISFNSMALHGNKEMNFTEKMKELNMRKKQESLIQEGRSLVKLLKEAEKLGFAMEEINLGLKKCNQDLEKTLKWLKNDWQMSVETLITMVTNEGTRMEQNEIGELSFPEAKKALRESNGDLDGAAAVCIANRRDMYKEISSQGNFAREQILMALLTNKGNVEEALDELNLASIQPFYERVWAEFDNVPLAAGAMARPMDMQDEISVTNSILSHQDFWASVTDKNVDMNRRVRMILVEGKLQSWGRAEVVIKILDVDVANNQIEASLGEIVEAVKNCQDYKSSMVYLSQECQICMGRFAMSRIRSLSSCECKICVDCMKGYFEVCIREKHVRNLNCPLCSQPDMEDVDAATNYLTFLTMLLQTIISQEDLQLYDSKLRDWNLQKDPHFRWCAHCGNGFIWDRQDVPGMVCPQCHKKTCYNCKKQWEDQHEGLTCEDFEQWKIDNDPENQAMGVARHLEINGIDCPSCKMRYALAKGGCMHFKCPQCGHEFCSGCSKPFVKQGPCIGYQKCKGKGIHSHHPRDCFYYLRDNAVEDLQRILRDKKLHFNHEAPDAGDMATPTCPVMEQKEIDSSKKDEACGREVLKGHAGLCVNHYKEYLVGILNKNRADPINILMVDEMKNLLEREEKNVPSQKEGERDGHYRKRLASYIKEKLPIKQNR
ncbi:uncharacterized protein [Argopecten irradians]|uniref:uncharacterized protein n=1 Tax=Argopecten irradians TaxID=31199 RepID=UPI0037121992